MRITDFNFCTQTGLLSSIEANEEFDNNKNLMNKAQKDLEIIFKMSTSQIEDYAADYKKRAEAEAIVDDAFENK